MSEIQDQFEFHKIKGYERIQVEDILHRVIAAHKACLEDIWCDRDDDEEQLIDDMFDILKPSEDDELLYLQVIDQYLDLLDET